MLISTYKRFFFKYFPTDVFVRITSPKQPVSTVHCRVKLCGVMSNESNLGNNKTNRHATKLFMLIGNGDHNGLLYIYATQYKSSSFSRIQTSIDICT